MLIVYKDKTQKIQFYEGYLHYSNINGKQLKFKPSKTWNVKTKWNDKTVGEFVKVLKTEGKIFA